MNFKNQVVYLTGASSGVGRELALQLGRKGAKLALFARRYNELEKAAAEAKSAGAPQADCYALDVTDRAAVTRVMAEAALRTGPCDVMFLNAGIELTMSARRFDASKVEKVYAVNVLGQAYCIESILPHMLKTSRGCIVGISSLSAYSAMPAMFTYASSKAAFSGMLEGLRLELRPRGVKVLTMCPGFIRTPMVEAAKISMPMTLTVEDAAKRILRATERGDEVYDFPAPMAWMIKGTKALMPTAALAYGWKRMTRG